MQRFYKELNLFYKHYFFPINWFSITNNHHNKKSTSIQNSKLDCKDLEKHHVKEGDETSWSSDYGHACDRLR